MKKIIKILVGIAIVLVVLLVVAVLIVGTHLGQIVKAGMENIGPKVTQTTLTVDTVDVHLFDGKAGVKNLVLGNPEGFKALQSISVSNAAISLEPGSVLSDKIVIHSIKVVAPEITFEGNPLGANNLNKIMDNVNSMTGPVNQATTNAVAPTTPSGQQKQAKKLEVDDFLITGAVVHANLTGLINRQIDLPIPDIHFTDLGKGNDGITAADLIQKVLGEITTDTIKTLATYAGSLGKDATNAAKGAATDLLQGASTNSVNKLKSGIGNLFK